MFIDYLKQGVYTSMSDEKIEFKCPQCGWEIKATATAFSEMKQCPACGKAKFDESKKDKRQLLKDVSSKQGRILLG